MSSQPTPEPYTTQPLARVVLETVGAEFLDRGSWVDSSMGLAAQTPDQVPEEMETLDGNPEIFETPHHMGRA